MHTGKHVPWTHLVDPGHAPQSSALQQPSMAGPHAMP
jgi:hypothetical protein